MKKLFVLLPFVALLIFGSCKGGGDSSEQTGKGIKVAVSDSGVDVDHEDLKDNVIKGSRNYGYYDPSYWNKYDNPTPHYVNGKGTLKGSLPID